MITPIKPARLAMLLTMLVIFVTGCQRDQLTDFNAASVEQDPIFNEITDVPQMREAESYLLDESTVLRRRYVTFDSAQMERALGNGNEVLLNLFNDYEVTAYTTNLRSEEGVQTLSGEVAGAEYSRVSLSFAGDQMMGMVHTDDRIFRIMPLGDGSHVIAEVFQSNFVDGDCQQIEEVEHDHDANDPGHSTHKVGSTTIKVLLVLPANGMSIWCSNSIFKNLLKAQAKASLDDTWGGYSANVTIYCSSYNYNGDASTDLNWLKNDATIASVRASRNADLVCMFQPTMTGVIDGQTVSICGYAQTPSSVSASTSDKCHSIVKFSCAFDNYSFPHEIGHNLGMYHDRYVMSNYGTDTRCGYGYVQSYFGLGSGRSIMAYNTYCSDGGGNCTRMGFFSQGAAPLITGIPCGQPLGTGLLRPADNWSQLEDAFPYVSAYN